MTTSTIDEIQLRETRHVLQTYRRHPLTLVRGEGVRLYDAEGNEYLDLLSGIGVASLGHAHPGLAAAIADQARTLLHTSNLFFHPLQGALAERLAKLSGLPRAFFCNSGAEAVEACLKFARRYWFQHDSARTDIIALEDSFHGRTFGSLSVTANDHYRAPFAPLLTGVRFIKPNDVRALNDAVTPRTAAIIAEPIQGEGGLRPLTAEFAAAINDASSRTGALVIADEVQSGLGRTGHAFYSHAIGLKPHLVSVGKALGGGVPVGAALLQEEVASRIAFGDHGSTYGGNLLACRAALCVLDALEGGLMANARTLGVRFEARLRAMASKHALIKDVRGIGLMWGIQLTGDATPVVAAALERRLIVNRTAETVIRLLPPLILNEADADEALTRLDDAFDAVSRGAHA